VVVLLCTCGGGVVEEAVHIRSWHETRSQRWHREASAFVHLWRRSGGGGGPDSQLARDALSMLAPSRLTGG